MFDTEVGIRRASLGLACLALAGVGASADGVNDRHYAGQTNDQHAVGVVRTTGVGGGVRIQTMINLVCGGKDERPAPLRVVIYRVPVGGSGVFRVRLLTLHPTLRRVVVSIVGRVHADRVDGTIAARVERSGRCHASVHFTSRRIDGQYG